MKSIRTAIVCVVALAGVAMASADQTKEFTKFMNAFYPKLVKAYNAKDISFFVKTSTADFVEVSSSGVKAPKKQALNALDQTFKAVKSMTIKSKNVTYKADKGKGVVAGKWVYEGLSRPDKNGKTHKLQITEYSKETWVKTSGGWLISKVEETKPAEVLLDGHAFGMGGSQ